VGIAFAAAVALASATTPWVAAVGALLLACFLLTDRGVAAVRRVKRKAHRAWVRACGCLERRLAGRRHRPRRFPAEASPYAVGNGRVARVDAARASRSASVVPWAVEIEISGASIDAGGLVRLEKAFERDVPHFEADCALWSQLLAVQGVVESSEDPREALASALKMMSSAFDEAGIDMDRASEITNVSIRRTRRRKPASDPDSLPQALLGVVPPAPRGSSSVETMARKPSHSSSKGAA
jgi:hypothetical protein